MLDYVALGILIFAAITLFYGIIVIHDIPYEIAVHRNHPHQDAIHYAGWVSLFTLHAIWPFLWIWSTLYREDRGWGFDASGGTAAVETEPETTEADVTEKEEPRQEPVLAEVADTTGAGAEAASAESVSAEAITLIRHKLEALDDRIGRIEEAIMAADNDQGGAN